MIIASTALTYSAYCASERALELSSYTAPDDHARLTTISDTEPESRRQSLAALRQVFGAEPQTDYWSASDHKPSLTTDDRLIRAELAY